MLQAAIKSYKWSILLLALSATLREGIESVLFLTGVSQVGGGGGELVPCSAPLAARLGGWASSLCSIFALRVAGVKACLAGLLAEACMPTVPSNLL